MKRIRQWFKRRHYSWTLNRAIELHRHPDTQGLALLEFCLYWLPQAQYTQPLSNLHVGSTTLTANAPNVDTLILDIRDALLDIRSGRELDAFIYNLRPRQHYGYRQWLTDLKGYSLRTGEVRDVLVRELQHLYDALALGVSLDDELSSYYRRHTQLMIIDCFGLTQLLLADSDHPWIYTLS